MTRLMPSPMPRLMPRPMPRLILDLTPALQTRRLPVSAAPRTMWR